MNMNGMIYEQIKAALGTQEDGADLVIVARNAHKAEQELAAFKRRVRDMEWPLEKAYEKLT